MQTLRSFIAINLPKAVLTEIEQITRSFQKTKSGVRWVKADSVHITLKFLGDISEGMIPRIAKAVEIACTDVRHFTLFTDNPGAFPNWGRPKVFWLGVHEKETGMISLLQSAIEGNLEPLGFPRDDRTFKAHLTLGRVKFPKNVPEISEQLQRLVLPNLEIPVTSIELMKSELTPRGAVYSVLQSFPLQKT